MIIEKLNEQKLQVFISHDDMQEWEIEADSLTQNSPEAQMLFNDVIMQARLDYNFACEGSNIVVEAVPDSDKGLKVFLTVVKESESQPAPAGGLPPIGEGHKSKMLVLRLTDLQDVTTCAKHLLPIYHGPSHLFKYQGSYYIALQAANVPYASVFDMGEIIDNPDVFYGYLNEYAEAIVRNDFL